LDHAGVVEQTIEKRGCDHRIPEHRTLPSFSTGSYLTSRSRIRITPSPVSGLPFWRSARDAGQPLSSLNSLTGGDAQSAARLPIWQPP
jgi:hypothetical protein